jgi:hypothetical protein
MPGHFESRQQHARKRCTLLATRILHELRLGSDAAPSTRCRKNRGCLRSPAVNQLSIRFLFSRSRQRYLLRAVRSIVGESQASRSRSGLGRRERNLNFASTTRSHGAARDARDHGCLLIARHHRVTPPPAIDAQLLHETPPVHKSGLEQDNPLPENHRNAPDEH